MSIIIENISKTYKKQVALNSINLNIKKGEIVGLLGPNGAGKSTLIKILTGYISANYGEVKICGDNMNENPKLVKKKIGYLAENNPLYIEMYIKEYLKYIAEIYKVSFYEIDEIIELTGLNSEKNKKINQLSKGYKQRVGLAAALIHNPEVLILDEPTTGLDPNQLIEIRKLIKNIGNNKTVIFSTHILQEVEKICDRIIIINKGNIVEDQKVDDLNKNKVNIETHFQKLTS
tara:strand:- start:1872 stop:2567 length:696 start_codon:yes stop_codon:yes gene_type:complete